MSKVFKLILSLSLLISVQTEAAAGRFTQSVWKFVKAPSIALGVSGSIFKYNQSNKENKEGFLDIQTTTERERSLAVRQGDYSLEVKKIKIKDFCKTKRGIPIDYVIYLNDKDSKEMPAAAASCNGKSVILLGDPFKPDSDASPAVRKFLLGHECAHLDNEDSSKNTLINSLLPLSATTTWRLARFGGRGIIISLAAGALASVGHNLFSAQHSQCCEYKADRESSTNPIILEAGAKYLESSIFEEKEPLQITVTSKNGERVHKPLKNILYIAREFHTHPPSKERAKRLREQAAKLRAEKKTE